MKPIRALSFSLVVFLINTTSAHAGLSTAINPFGVPDVGTGIAIYAETSGTEAVTAQAWKITGHIVNHDAPLTGAGGFLTPGEGNRVQRQSETALASFFDAADSGAPYDVNDSYWGNHFTNALLGTGYNGSGEANPDGSAETTMELQGGTSFGVNPAPSELLLYIVITEPVFLEGELAIGAGTIESFSGCLDTQMVHPLPHDPDFCIPEPASLSLALLTIAALLVRRTR